MQRAIPPLRTIAGMLALLILVPTAQGQEIDPAGTGLEEALLAEEEAAEADAEEPAEPPVPPLVLKANALTAEYHSLVARHDDLEAQMKAADESDVLVFDRQLVEVKLEFLELMGRIVENLLAQEKQGLEAAELRDLTTNELTTLTPAIVHHLEQSTELTQSIRKRRDEAEAAEVLQIEQELEREIYLLDRLFGAYAENIEHREVLGLDITKPTNDFEELLKERTRLQGARLKLTLDQLGELGHRIAEDPEDAGLRAEKASLEVRRKTLIASLSRLVKMMDAAGLDASEQQKLIITSTGEVTSDIFKPEVALGLFDEWVAEVQKWFRDNGPGVFFKVLVFLIIIMTARIASGLTRRVLHRALSTSRMQASQLLQSMMIGVIGNLVLLVGILLGLSQLGFELGPLLAGLGIAGFIVGFALQDSLANFAAGMMILGYRPFDVGDVIEAAGVLGKVNHMSLVNTTILTYDNRTLIIPNNKIWGDVITNLTNQDKRRVDLLVRIGYEQDLDRCEAVLRDVLAQDPRILEDPPPVVKLHKFGESAMEIIVRPWTTTSEYWSVYWDMTGAIKRRLDVEGIPIAVPRTEVHMRSEPDTSS